MQVSNPLDEESALVGWGVRVLFLASPGNHDSEIAAKRITGFGGIIEAEVEVFAALEAVIEDPVGYGLFVMDCDVFGGLQVGRKAFAMLRAANVQLPVILISQDCGEQIFPEDRSAPIILRSPLSAVALRVGFEHALRDRMMWRGAA